MILSPGDGLSHLDLDLSVTLDSQAWLEALTPALSAPTEEALTSWLNAYLTDCVQKALSAEETHQRWADTNACFQALFEQHPPEDLEIGLLLTDDHHSQTLNKTYRQKDKPTNVLSFALIADLEDPSAPHQFLPGMPLCLGDLVLAYETVAREAEQAEKAMADHLRHLLLHGLLHLLGHDHENDMPGAILMEGLETRLLKDIGLSDPYAEL